MLKDATPYPPRGSTAEQAPPHPPAKKKWRVQMPSALSAHEGTDGPARYQAELFYLQKQIQMKTHMAVVLEDGEKLEGCIEWYDRHSLKLRGRSRTLVFKSAIKYMYKIGEA
jgi:sRNA-binding regulator protein Hfq